jgi:carbonic anhydrase/acetyltransferase-like protein (isoleucine patch superfamily)
MAGALLYGARIELIGTGNTLTIGAGSRLWGSTIQLRGDNLRCHIGRNCRLRQTVMVIEDQGSRIDVGDESSGTACTLLACEGGLVQIGRDCMMSVASDIRNSDGHSVIELVSGERVNPAADVIVEDHAWIGLRVQILKGVRVGGHSIAAAGSVVVKDVPPNTIVAGIPARPIRSGITWIRERIPVRDVAEIQSVN